MDLLNLLIVLMVYYGILDKKYYIKTHLTKEQKSKIFKYRDAQRYAYNWALGHIIEDMNSDKKVASEYDLSVMFTKYKHECEWMDDIPYVWFNMGIKDASKAANLSIVHGRDNPKFRTKKHSRAMPLKCDLKPKCQDAYTMQLPKFGYVTCNIPKKMINETHEPRSYEFVDVTKHSDAPVEKRNYILQVSCKINSL